MNSSGNHQNIFAVGIILFLSAIAGFSAENKEPIIGYTDTPFLPSGWRVHDIDRPQPAVVTPGGCTTVAPSDAIVLFDGSNLDQWVGSKQDDPEEKRYNPEGMALWKLEDGYMECTPTGNLISKQAFSDCQLHVEWRVELPAVGDSQGRGNSGVFLMGLYEVQVLDSYQNRTYADGSAGSIYGQTPPMVNASRKPGEWQSYDIVFEAPVFDGERLVKPAYFTVFQNGVLLHNRQAAMGPMRHRRLTKYSPHEAEAPLMLQGHGNPVRYRNIWVRRLRGYDEQ